MDVKQVLSFIKIEHTLFSLPFVLIGYILAHNEFVATDTSGAFSWIAADLLWILLAAVGARGLAMGLNRIIDRNVDAENPRTAGRHLASGTMSMRTAWTLCGVFLVMLLGSAAMLNQVALLMSWLPVSVFVVYPFLKRYTWLCHFWLGLCLGLAPAGAWVAVAADHLGWAAVTGGDWYPSVFFIALGVALWIAAFDLNYARMDIESDRANGIKSFPAQFGDAVTTRTSVQLTLVWFACFAISNPMSEIYFLASAAMMSIVNILVIVRQEQWVDFQTTLFRASMLTGWILLAAIVAMDPMQASA
ncbi:MAG: putative 4-hydroxybenzoate polyprenyltransferase [Candidatus Poseidoniaceae archaeon]|nr:putative 4-hydroxybenzoate polyprenyltransferase [Candidatus Poseidoniaceae archaeon]